MRFTLAVLALCLSAPMARAEADMAVECALQGQLAQTVADARIAGTRKAKAERETIKGLSEETAKYAEFVPMLVAFIYDQVPQEVVDDTVGASWEAQCLAAAGK